MIFSRIFRIIGKIALSPLLVCSTSICSSSYQLPRTMKPLDWSLSIFIGQVEETYKKKLQFMLLHQWHVFFFFWNSNINSSWESTSDVIYHSKGLQHNPCRNIPCLLLAYFCTPLALTLPWSELKSQWMFQENVDLWALDNNARMVIGFWLGVTFMHICKHSGSNLSSIKFLIQKWDCVGFTLELVVPLKRCDWTGEALQGVTNRWNEMMKTKIMKCERWKHYNWWRDFQTDDEIRWDFKIII